MMLFTATNIVGFYGESESCHHASYANTKRAQPEFIQCKVLSVVIHNMLDSLLRLIRLGGMMVLRNKIRLPRSWRISLMIIAMTMPYGSFCV